MKRDLYVRGLVLAGVMLLSAGTACFANEMDGRIEDSARNTYVFRNYLRHDSVKVKSLNGAVTLTGKVTDDRKKDLAEDAVSNLPGVETVSNQLEVREEIPSEYSDAWVAAKVKTALLYHRNVSGTKTQVDVKEGIVTLRGDAESASQKELTAKYAKDIDGVKGVNNEMKIVESKKEDRSLGEKIDDASITAQIKAVLLIHRSTSAIKTEVHTKDGVVTVEGQAKNGAEKALVGELIQDVRGVKSVKNNMTTA